MINDSNKENELTFFIGQVQMYITLIVHRHSGCNSPAFKAITELETFFNASLMDIFKRDFGNTVKDVFLKENVS